MNKTRMAQIVSIAGHPFVMIVLLVLLLSWNVDPAGAWRITGFVAAVGLIPTGWLAWRHFAAPQKPAGEPRVSSSRPVLYATMLGVLLLSALYFYFGEHSVFLARGALITALMAGAAAAINPWVRLSLHLTFAVYCGLVIAKIHPVGGVLILLLTPLLAWARLTLKRHTLTEVIGGSILGLGSATVFIIFWS